MTREKQIAICLGMFTFDFSTLTGSHCELVACALWVPIPTRSPAHRMEAPVFCAEKQHQDDEVWLRGMGTKGALPRLYLSCDQQLLDTSMDWSPHSIEKDSWVLWV